MSSIQLKAVLCALALFTVGIPLPVARAADASTLASTPVPAAAEAREEVLRNLLSLELQRYDAMSLRDENWKDRPAAFEKLKSGFTRDFRAITGWNELLTREQYCAILPKIRLNKYELSDPQLVQINSDTIILAYLVQTSEADEHGGHETKDRVASTWVRQDGKWLNAFHQSTRTSGTPFSSQ